MTQMFYGFTKDVPSQEVFTVKWGNEEAAWNACHFLSHVIPVTIKKFKEGLGVGNVPSSIYVEAIKELGLDVEAITWHYYENEADAERASELATVKWHSILDKMIFSFEQLNTNDDHDMMMEDYSLEYDPEYRAKVEEGQLLFIQYFRALWN